jgi:hypothetical protein
VGAVRQGGQLLRGDTFQLDFHAALLGFTGPQRQPFALPPGLNATYEITAAVSLTEVVVTAGTFPGAATFRAADVQSPNSFIEFYFDDTPDADAFNGTGFNDGRLILQADPSSLLRNEGNFGLTTPGPPPCRSSGRLTGSTPTTGQAS